MPMVPWIGRTLVQVEPDLARAVAGFHAGFNIVIALAFLLLLTPVARLLERTLPNRLEITDPLRAALSGRKRNRVSVNRARLCGAGGAAHGRRARLDD
jgi:Na+/phosphate symporter